MATKWISTMYETPEEWGSYVEYGDEMVMLETIAALKDAGGKEWDDIGLDDCTSYDLVNVVSDDKAVYQENHRRYPSYIAVEHPEEPKVSYFNSLGDALEHLVTFQDAVKMMAAYNRSKEVVAVIYDAVEPICETDTNGLYDWLNNTGGYDGTETPASIAAEWDLYSDENA